MFNALSALKNGDALQQRAYEAIDQVGVLDQFASYQPIVCGTIPLNIHVDDSDLDIIFYVDDFDRFAEELQNTFQQFEGFHLKRITIKGEDVVKANFHAYGFEFELFGMNKPTERQHAYLHMVIEAALLERFSWLKDAVTRMKQQGYKTEAAFCECLGIQYHDPFDALLDYGRYHHFI
ncbi:hypothetical protein ABID56_002017 [Alkalibacillus flavidus]|uniref:DUF4269 domain-containing protein n=1 Tax=Alkalibacillus flavidus TaxID=546021 RepID=A0ABV2KWD6_9BACI